MIRLGVRGKLLASFAVVFVLVGALGVALYLQTAATSDTVTGIGDHTLPEVATIGDLHLAVAAFQRDQLNYIAAPTARERSDALAGMDGDAGEVNDAFMSLGSAGLDAAERTQYQAARADWATYQRQTADLVSLVDADRTDEARALMFGDGATTFDSFDKIFDAWTQTLDSGARGDVQTSQGAIAFLYLLLAGGGLAIALVGSVLAVFISGRITTGIRAVQANMAAMREGVVTFSGCLTRLGENDLTAVYRAHIGFLDLKGSDEICAIAAVSNELLGELKTMAGAYETARRNLSAALGEVKDAAASVARTSAQLTGAAHQSGAASTQIAQTIGQVAAGAQDQARAAASTSTSVAELTASISQVGNGAAETARKVDASAAAVTKLATAIDTVGQASSEVSGVSAEAAVAAAEGLGAVATTVSGMDRIKEAVEASAAKVAELGAKSDAIGAIVETIDDIAAQTNLLALNAAIEAARAGEQGKGFAVVADEVRKLAERSSRATREIAALISDVQRETAAAVAAMTVGSAEVATGITLADQAGASLEAIAGSVAGMRAASERIIIAVGSMADASSGVVSATDAIEAIAAGTNDAATRMTASAGSVSAAIDSIAAISEENSASAEEVSAATEELSAQVEEIVASAASLADMAAQLDALVARFRLSSEPEASSGMSIPVDLTGHPRSRAA